MIDSIFHFALIEMKDFETFKIKQKTESNIKHATWKTKIKFWNIKTVNMKTESNMKSQNKNFEKKKLKWKQFQILIFKKKKNHRAKRLRSGSIKRANLPVS